VPGVKLVPSIANIMQCGGIVPSARARPIASARPKPCDETVLRRSGMSLVQSIRWMVPGGESDCAASINHVRRADRSISTRAVASPSCSMTGICDFSRRATTRPTPSSPRSGLPTPMTKKFTRAPHPASRNAWRTKYTDRGCAPPARTADEASHQACPARCQQIPGGHLRYLPGSATLEVRS